MDLLMLIILRLLNLKKKTISNEIVKNSNRNFYFFTLDNKSEVDNIIEYFSKKIINIKLIISKEKKVIIIKIYLQP